MAIIDKRAVRAVVISTGARAVVIIHVIMACAAVAARIRVTLVYFSAVTPVTLESFIARARIIVPVNATASGMGGTRGPRTGINFGHVNVNRAVKCFRGNSVVFGFYQNLIGSNDVIIVTEM